jgi:chromosome segregation ATPase
MTLKLRDCERDLAEMRATRELLESAAESQSSQADMMRQIQHDLETSVQIHKDKARDADARARDLEQRLETLEASATASQAVHAEATRELEYLSTSYKTLADEVLRSQSEYAEAVETAETEQARAMEAQMKLKRVELEMKEHRATAEERLEVLSRRWANERDQLESQLQGERVRAEQLAESLAALTSERDEHMDAVRLAISDCEGLAELTDVLQSTTSAMQAASADAEVKAREQESSLAQLQTELDTAADAGSGFTRDVSGIQAECEELVPLIETLEGRIKSKEMTARDTVQGLEDELKSVRDTLDKAKLDQANRQGLDEAAAVAIKKSEVLEIEVEELQKRATALADENAVLAGHGNPAQKIKHVVALKNQVERYRKSETAMRTKLDAALRLMRDAGMKLSNDATSKSPREAVVGVAKAKAKDVPGLKVDSAKAGLTSVKGKENAVSVTPTATVTTSTATTKEESPGVGADRPDVVREAMKEVN